MVPGTVIISPSLMGNSVAQSARLLPLPRCLPGHLCTPACLVALLVHPRLLWVLSYLPVSCSSTIPCLPSPLRVYVFPSLPSFEQNLMKQQRSKVLAFSPFPHLGGVCVYMCMYVCMCACVPVFIQTITVGKRSTLGIIFFCPRSWHLHHDEMLACKSHCIS